MEGIVEKTAGIEVDASGVITAQGRRNKKSWWTVKILWDDPKMATQNLPADAVKKKYRSLIKIRKKTEFTGVSDGESEKVLNLELKADKRLVPLVR